MNIRRLALAWTVLLVGGCHEEVGSTPFPLDVAPPEHGFQIPIGPFDVPAGAEVQLCRTMKLSNTTPVALNRLQVVMPPGSHHFILFRSEQDFPDQVFPCWGTVNFDSWEFMVDVNKAGGIDWQLPAGQGFVLQPHQQIMVQAHFVNATTAQSPAGGAAVLNMYEAPLASVIHPLHGMFTVNTKIHIPPHSEFSTTRHCTFSNTVYLAAMTGHFHARGEEFTVNRVTSGDLKEQMYDSLSWDSPTFKIFDSPPVFNLGEEGVSFTCKYMNNTDTEIGWGSHADVQEHCNLFFQYYFFNATSTDPTPLSCAEGSGGW